MAETRDVQVGQNLLRHRGIRSQQSLAKAMRDRGWKWSQATVWSIEKGERPLKFLEAVDLGDVLEIQTDDLLREPALATATRDVADRTRQVQILAGRATDALVEFNWERLALDRALDVAATLPEWDRLADVVEIGKALSYTSGILADLADTIVGHEATSLFHATSDQLSRILTDDEIDEFDPEQWRVARSLAPASIPTVIPAEGEADGLDHEAAER